MRYSARQLFVAIVMIVAVASTAWAGPADHTSGFFLRLQGGASVSNTAISDPLLTEFELSGIGGNFQAAIGAVVAPNLALHGTMWAWFVGSPSAKLAGQDVGQFSGNLNLSALGGGGTYYFMPANVYLSGNLGVGQLSTEGSSSDAGIVMDLALGKEWWVSSKWGLGLSGGVQYHSIPDGGLTQNWSGTTFLLSFSATLN
jgi:hypothetical protein